ncbi:YraN family protein [Leptolyngbya sp. NK1-12]|uniref:UPF0102 protein HJG54_06490 n=1 Tax=Leptolyngbya sp. NK1-12 TaxID=2547451 RepID=A0AA96WJK6_9CYAN|nr:YraN family protein [Leptolyngbya sp. NK1-12]WNZ22541.1 YraN family protein [Leptolyngbya sp. NK1-12]
MSQQIGRLAETLVANWLKQQNWQILAQRWHCRWGELDLVAFTETPQPWIAFVEVKARSSGNWDADGLLAITPAKQEKLLRAAQLFLSTYPEQAELPCRFDVAIVHYQQVYDQPQSSPMTSPPTVELGQPLPMGQYCLMLQDYIVAAFE